MNDDHVSKRARKLAQRSPLLSAELLRPAVGGAFTLLHPRRLVRNPVMLVTAVGAVLSTVSGSVALVDRDGDVVEIAAGELVPATAPSFGRPALVVVLEANLALDVELGRVPSTSPEPTPP